MLQRGGMMTGKAVREQFIQWVTDYKDVAERNALAETPEESADYLLTVEVAGIPLSELIEKAKSGKLVELANTQVKPALRADQLSSDDYQRGYRQGQYEMESAGFRRVRAKG
ncbi:hypothetical protein LCGC14_0513600 [marine sediment metagenome]|uniref:Uncharacterized protein n=1 Tax=marine sediment metagenome TaxID=412755 RepID=A0A0F9V8Q4_9ZZZZ